MFPFPPTIRHPLKFPSSMSMCQFLPRLKPQDPLAQTYWISPAGTARAASGCKSVSGIFLPTSKNRRAAPGSKFVSGNLVPISGNCTGCPLAAILSAKFQVPPVGTAWAAPRLQFCQWNFSFHQRDFCRLGREPTPKSQKMYC